MCCKRRFFPSFLCGLFWLCCSIGRSNGICLSSFLPFFNTGSWALSCLRWHFLVCTDLIGTANALCFVSVLPFVNTRGWALCYFLVNLIGTDNAWRNLASFLSVINKQGRALYSLAHVSWLFCAGLRMYGHMGIGNACTSIRIYFWTCTSVLAVNFAICAQWWYCDFIVMIFAPIYFAKLASACYNVFGNWIWEWGINLGTVLTSLVTSKSTFTSNVRINPLRSAWSLMNEVSYELF